MSEDGSTAHAPSLLVSVIALLMRHAMTGIGGMLLANGILTKDTYAQLVTLGLSVSVTLAGLLWSYIEKHNKIAWIGDLLKGS